MAEQHLDTVQVTGSNPVAPTKGVEHIMDLTDFTYMVVKPNELEGEKFDEKEEAFRHAQSGDDILTHDKRGNLVFLRKM